MKKFLALVLVFVAISCSPARYVVNVEMRYPSRSGLELAGKSLSVVYLESENKYGTSMMEGVVDGFASTLEKDYGKGEGEISVYSIKPDVAALYSSRDSLMNILMDTGTDVVFLFDSLKMGTLTMGGTEPVASAADPDSSYITTGNLPFTMSLYCYDSLNKADKVFTFSGKSTAVPHAYSDGKQDDSVILERAVSSLEAVGYEAGRSVSSSFQSQWKHEQYSIVYFESEKWFNAVLYAEQYSWKQAMDLWFELLDTNDVLKRSAAAYNISVACYMLGEIDLASQWLDRSDADSMLPFSEAMRKRIKARN